MIVIPNNYFDLRFSMSQEQNCCKGIFATDSSYFVSRIPFENDLHKVVLHENSTFFGNNDTRLGFSIFCSVFCLTAYIFNGLPSFYGVIHPTRERTKTICYGEKTKPLLLYHSNRGNKIRRENCEKHLSGDFYSPRSVWREHGIWIAKPA